MEGGGSDDKCCGGGGGRPYLMGTIVVAVEATMVEVGGRLR